MAILHIRQVQPLAFLRRQDSFRFVLGCHQQAVKPSARPGTHEICVLPDEGVFWGDVLRELVKILSTQDKDLLNMDVAGDASHCVLTKQSQRFYMGRKRGVLFFVQSVHLSLKSVDVNPEGAGGAPQGGVWYPNAMLAQLSTGWERKSGP